MMWKIEIKDKPGVFDAAGEGVKKDILDLGISGVEEVSFAQVYFLEGSLERADVVRVCEALLADPVTQEYHLLEAGHERAAREGARVVEVAYNPGVMDPVEESVRKGIADLGLAGADTVKTAKRYYLKGTFSEAHLKTVCEKLLYNKTIQHIVDLSDAAAQPHALKPAGYQFKLTVVDLLGASDAALEKISKDGQLYLNLAEMRQIQGHFRKIGRNPTDCELETIAQTWSEHCAHKTFRGRIEYKEKVSGKNAKTLSQRKINNLLKSTIMKATRELDKPWCISVFKDNSGVINFDEKHHVCFKVETHNHPSALEPFGGANTGIGGVIRDPLGTGLGAKPILNTDVFCFAPPDHPFEKVPQGSLHPKRVMKGVVSGVRDYGNKMGIPTVNGAIIFDEGYAGNPLVYCGTLGVMPRDKAFKEIEPGDLVVVVGGRTGRDGIHGATFSSGELTHESEVVSSGAVQIGNPIQEKKMADTILQARDKKLYDAITDCGAGGLSSAVGEMGAECGARVDLEKVPLKYTGLSYTEIWISESQERMVLAVPKSKIERLRAVFAAENVEAAVIGEFTDTGRLELFYKGNRVCDLDMKFLHEGLPQIEKKAYFALPKHKEPAVSCPKDLTPELHKLLGHYSVCSKEWVIRQYDHEVQGGSVMKPLVGIVNDGPADAAIVKPVLGSHKAVVISNGINCRFGMIDPYWMAASCIDEALRQIVAVGGSLHQVALLDNFCWGNPDKPDRLGGLVRAAVACHDFSKAYGVPFISGKDSLYNEYAVEGKSVAIPGTLLISALGIMEDARQAVSMYAKEAGNLVYAVGMSFDELGGSHYFGNGGAIGNAVPRVHAAEAMRGYAALHKAAARGLVRAMHDCSEGGIGVAAAEMAFSGGLGMEIFLQEVPYRVVHTPAKAGRRDDFVLFSESNSRLLVEVPKDRQKEFEKLLKGVAFGLIGCVSKEKYFTVHGINQEVCVRASLNGLKESWQKPLRW